MLDVLNAELNELVSGSKTADVFLDHTSAIEIFLQEMPPENLNNVLTPSSSALV